MQKLLIQVVSNVADFSVRRSMVVLVLILLAVGIDSALRAIANPFWYDEIFTVLMCRLPSGAETWKALEQAADTNPPTYHALARAARRIIPDDHVGYRLPSVLAALGAMFGLYWFLVRRVDGLAALVGATFVLCTPLIYYAAEARPYALMVCCISVAAAAWQRIDESWLWSVVLAVLLAGAISCHYYASLAWPAFVLAEASVWAMGRRFRVGAWAAFVGGAVPLWFFAPLLAKLREYYGPNFWARPAISQAWMAYDWLFSFGGQAGMIFGLGVIAIFAYQNFIQARQQIAAERADNSTEREERESLLPLAERVLVLVLLLLPAIAVAVAKFSQGGLTARYMLPTILGGCLVVGYLASKLSRVGRALLLGLILINYASSSLGQAKRLVEGTLLERRAAAAKEMGTIVRAHPESELPLVVSAGRRYLPMAYYTPDDLVSRLYTIADPKAAVKYTRVDSVDLDLVVIRRYFPLRIADYAEFLSRHREFLLVSDSGERFEWLTARLLDDGHVLNLIGQNGGAHIYKATVKTVTREVP
jgi:hypothetical protein